MAKKILITGATGTVGAATLQALAERDVERVAFVRSRLKAEEMFGSEVEVRVGDLGDEASVSDALRDVDAALLCSGHGADMAEQQLTAVRAIAASSVTRVVKISASPVAMARARVGKAHAEVEGALAATGRSVVSIRPNAFMQNFLAQAVPIKNGALPGPDGDPRVSFIDARDVGRVAAASLLAEGASDRVIELTGPESITWFDAAEIMSEVLGRTITHYPVTPDVIRTALTSMGQSEWEVEHAVELGALMREAEAAQVNDNAERVMGRPPARLWDFVADHEEAFRE